MEEMKCKVEYYRVHSVKFCTVVTRIFCGA